jgi:hypothetical protein
MRRYRLFVLLLLTGWLTACSTPGAFFGATEGPLFQPRSLSDENRVLLYLYRPQSSWADQELEAPGLFINNQLFSGLPSGGYLVMELDTASYQLEIRRPLLGSYWTLAAESPMDFTRVASFALDAEAGATYYLRYDELSPPPHDDSLAATGDGPLQLVSEQAALGELGSSHRIKPFARIAANGETHVRRSQRGFWRSVGDALDKIGI